MSDWIEVKITFDEAPADWSPYVDAFDRHGCPGTIQTDNPPSLSAYVADISGAATQVDRLSAELRELGATSISTSSVPDQDWSELWKIHFKPRRVGKSFVLVPTWEEYTPQVSDKVITLDPGQAFGTGDHPTTRLCLRLMEEINLQGKRVLDVGCGSGVLAIGAALLNASEIRATDIDLQAVEIAKRNFEINGIHSITADAADGFADEVSYDVVLSNIISATLIRLSRSASFAVKSGGHWIVSGIIEQNWADVKKAAEQSGFQYEKMEVEDGWVGAIFSR